MVFAQQESDLLQQPETGNILEFLFGIGKMPPDIAERSCAQESITNCVEQDISVRVAQEAQRMRDAHTTEDQFPTSYKPVNVITEPDANG